VIGGGIAGLSAAHELAGAGWLVEVHEASQRWGGKVWSSPVGDRLVDAGADNFLARAPEGVELCRELGLFDELTTPVAPVAAYLVGNGELRQMPAGSILGVPTDLEALTASGLISPAGVERARVDLTAEPTPLDPDLDDLSVGALCRARLGDEITDRLIDPILGGINASDIDRLSLTAGAPLLAAALSRSHSLMEGLAQLRPSTGGVLGGRPTGSGQAPPVFYGLPGGTARIVDALVARLEGTESVELRLQSPIDDLAPLTATVDAIVIATPSFVAAELLASANPEAAAELAAIEYASVAQVVVELPLDQLERELDAGGILFPRVDGTMITACTWLSSKWAHYRRPGTALLRLSSGRYGDDRPAAYGDDELVTTLLAELDKVIGVSGPPIAARVQRLTNALPQYQPGHAGRVARVEEALSSSTPHLVVAGAPYRGIGIPACIGSGRKAGRELIDALG
jgi:oxygen-dependent protoporphyrinogen oxidase